jgi:hypothetical protein
MRVAIAVNISFFCPEIFFGHTGEIIKSWFVGKYKMHRIKLDGCERTIDLYEDEIYFPDHVEGYNQPSLPTTNLRKCLKIQL